MTCSRIASVLLYSSMAWTSPGYSAQINVFDAATLQQALKNARAGDEIVLYPGYYKGNKATSGSRVAHFFSNRNGRAGNPVTLRSYAADDKQVLQGDSVTSGYGFYLTGDYWVIKDLKFRTAKKGIMLDDADHNVLDNTGDEAVHFRQSSSHNILKNCFIHDTGKRSRGFGEGVYVGTHNGDTSGDYSHHNLIGGCRIGPGVTAEHFDIKEGTKNTVIEHNTLRGTGVAGYSFNYADSFIDIKGNAVVVRNNVMNYEQNGNVTHGIHILKNKTHKSSNIYSNTITINTDDPFIKIGGGITHVSGNRKTTSGIQVTRYSRGRSDTIIESGLRQPGSYTGYTNTPDDNNDNPDNDDPQNCTIYRGSGKLEVDLSTSICIDFGQNLTGRKLQFWDSDANPECNFRGQVLPSNGSAVLNIDANYASTTAMTGQKVNIETNNDCPYIKMRII